MKKKATKKAAGPAALASDLASVSRRVARLGFLLIAAEDRIKARLVEIETRIAELDRVSAEVEILEGRIVEVDRAVREADRHARRAEAHADRASETRSAISSDAEKRARALAGRRDDVERRLDVLESLLGQARS